MDVVKLLEPFAVAHEQEWHLEALQTWGERVVIRRVFTVEDLRAGLTTRCAVCNAGPSQPVRDRVAAVYKQGGESYCQACWGTGYTGGFSPTAYITWGLASDAARRTQKDRTGVLFPDRPRMEFPWEPPLDQGDLVVRVDEWDDEADLTVPASEFGRFLTSEIELVKVRTGPQRPPDEVLVGQTSDMRALPQEHPLLELPAVPP
jgi:hypothetical protein